ncbi:uncharacterized protein METZ01_LOCUS56954 [marine metagenome]|uniref:arginine--tRNA ligase n=1 Tax=marine metagenome TaxID=408172 RepID=A0A381SJ61_9ZZZZ
MRHELRDLLAVAVSALADDGVIPVGSEVDIQLERTRQPDHGDFACNVAMVLAKAARMKPRDLAALLQTRLPASELIDKTEIAGPGFINIFLAREAYYHLIATVRQAGAAYGRSNVGDDQPIMVEFVSANPTGPLHVGHGRGAAYGDALVRVLRAAGYAAASEYYINDAGRQMDILAVSVWLRYLELCGEEIDFPPSAYQGDYVFDIAATLHRDHGADFQQPAADLMDSLPVDADQLLDTLISRAKNQLGADGFNQLHALGNDTLVDDIRNDLVRFGVQFDHWFSENHLVADGAVERVVQTLKDSQHMYLKDGAWWLRTTEFGDEKDRVVLRANGNHTYFATDIAYHLDKFERGFEHVINIWGADHHGYIKRVKASLAALGRDPDALTVLLVQFATLYRGAEKIPMSTRSGQFVTLRELRQEVGADAARYFYALRKPEQHMDFDLDLARSQSSDNPVYYIQYAHARICSVFRQLDEKGITPELESADHSLLSEVRELDLLRELSRYPEVVETAARSYEPHLVAYYLRDLANDFHTYYNAHPFIAADEALRNARLSLIAATQVVLANALDLLGVSAPESM